MASYVLAPNKAYPSIPTISGTLENHTLVLGAIQESMAIYERRTGNAADSFVRLSELEDLGIINIDQTTNIVVAPDDDGVFIRRDGTSPRTTGEIDIGAGLNMDMDTCIAWDNVDYVCVDSVTVAGSVTWPEPSAFSFQAAYIRPHLAMVGGPMYSVDGKKFYSVRDDGATSQIAVNSDSLGGKFATAYVPEEVGAGELVVLISRGSNRLRDCVWGENGTSVLAVEYGAEQIAQYNHTGTAYDLDTVAQTDSTPDATFALTSYIPRSIDISPDGTKIIFTANTTGRNIYEVDLSTPWDITSGTINTTAFQPSDEDMLCARYAPDGLAIFALGLSGVLYRYPLTTAYDLSTASTTASSSIDCAANLTYGTNAISFNISPDGTKLHVYEYHVSNANLNACQYYTASNPVSSTTTYTMTVGDPSAAMEIDATGVNLDTSIPISWNDTDFLVFDTSFPPGSEPVTDPYYGFVTCLVTAEAATIGAATFTSDIGDITWTWVGDNTEGTGGEWGYPTDESAKHGTMSIFTRGATGATFEGFAGPAQNSAEAVAAFPLNEGTTGEFCVDFWLDPALYNSSVWQNDYYVISSYNTQNASVASFRITVEANSGRASMIVPTGAARTIVLTQAGDVISNFEQESWHHYAFTRESDGEFRCYVDGVLKQRSGTGIYPSMASVNIQTPTNSQVLVWGGSLRSSGPNGQAAAAYVDSFRVTKGSARYYDGGAAVGTDIFGTTIDTDAGVPQGTPGTIGFKVGDETLAYPTDIYGSAINLQNPVTAASTVDITGAVTMASTLDVTGAVTMSSTLGVTGAVTMSSTLGVTGATTLSDTLGVTGATTLSSTLGVTGATTLSDTLGVTGATTLSSTLAVTGVSTFNSDVVLDAGTNTATWSSDDTDLTLTSVGLTDYNITGFTAINVDTTMGIEWGDTEYLALTGGGGGGATLGDPYFHLVTHLSLFNGADAATAYTSEDAFLDAWTFNGQAQLDTAQFKFGTSSLLLDGSGDTVTMPHRKEHLLDQGNDWTCEAWVRFNAAPSGQTPIVQVWDGASNYQWFVGLISGNLELYVYTTSAILTWSATWAPSTDTWYHVAVVVRDEGGTRTSRGYIDGTEIGTGDTTINGLTPATPSAAANLTVGGYSAGYLDGWVDSVRISQHARYTANFTAPTAAFLTSGQDDGWNSVVFSCDFDGADAATSATDDSASAHTISFNGNAQLDTAIVKSGTASLLLDGSGDYVSIPHSTEFEFGSDDFTIEAHFYFSGSLTTRRDLIAFWDANGANRRSWMTRWAGDLSPDSLEFVYSTNGTNFFFLNSTVWTPTASTWYHIAWVREADVLRFFVDGVQISSTALTATLHSPGSLTPLGIGAGLEASGWTNYHNGLIDNVRITKGVARYKSTFTPPVVNATTEGADEHYASTVLLCRFNGTDAATTSTDESGSAHTLTFNGDAQIDTAEFKEGGSSLLLDGTGDYVTIADSTDWDLAAGDFTIEAHVRWNSVSQQTIVSHFGSSGSYGWTLEQLNTTTLRFMWSTTGSDLGTITGAFTPTAGKWYHIAVSRTNNVLYMFVDGQLITSSALTATIHNPSVVAGIGGRASANFYFNGWIDNVRVTKGVARYIAPFDQVPPPVTYQTSAASGGAVGTVFSVGEAASSVALLGTSVTMAGSLVITDATEVDSVTFDHDGTDFNTTFVTTTDWNITGITSIQAGTVDADFDAITATSYGGITEANLVDKTAAETVTGAWTFSSEIQLTPQAAPAHTEGLVWYDSTEKAISYYNDEADVTINLGQENVIRVRNVSGALIPNGSAVYISGATGASLPNIDLARADVLSTAECIGLATHDIENNSNGYVTTLGLVRDLDTSSFSPGDELFLDVSTAGAWTATKPVGDYCVPIGYVTVSNVSVGEIKVTMHPEADRGDLTSASQNLTVSGNWTFTGTLDVSAATFTGLSSDDLSDVASIAMLDEAETVTGAWTFSDELLALSFGETSSSPSSATNAITFDIANGAAFEVTLTENITSITISNPPTTGNHAIVTIKFIQDATGSWTVSGWPASVKWPGGTAPTITTTLSTGTDIIILETWDAGTTWYGRFFQDYQ